MSLGPEVTKSGARELPGAKRGSAGSRRALLVCAPGWVGLIGLSLWGSGTTALHAPIIVLMALVVFWHGCALGRAAGLLSALACAGIGALAIGDLGAAGVIGLGVGLIVAGVGGGTVRRRHLRVRQRLETAEDDLAALRGSLEETRKEMAALRSHLDDAEHLAAVGTMSAQIAHQLRNPLTSMQLYVQLLEDELGKLDSSRSGEAFELLELVLNELKLLVEITDNYLRYARLPELAATTLDVNRTAGELVRFLRHEMARKGVSISTRLADGLPTVMADRRLLRFALINLFKNALEAMGSGGRLRVRTCQRDGAVEIHVSDTGQGIPPSETERIFEPFYTTKDSGSGLGLSLSRQIVEKHQGSLTCESMVDVGTTFIVRIPAGAGNRRPKNGGELPDSVDRG